jgi:hypothetical protein
MEREGTGPGETRPRFVMRLLRAFVSPNSYGLVLLLIVATYLVAVGVRERWGTSMVLLIQIATVWFVLRTSRAKRGIRIAADAFLVLAAIGAMINVAAGGDDAPSRLILLASIVLYLIAPFSVVRHIATRDAIDQETMLGAISAYLLFGMLFAFTYLYIGLVQSGPFFGPQGEASLPQVMFFSFTTLTTTGYGNLVPAANPGQSLAVLEMLVGQIFLITAVGKLVTVWRPRRWRPAEAPSGDEPTA